MLLRENREEREGEVCVVDYITVIVLKSQVTHTLSLSLSHTHFLSLSYSVTNTHTHSSSFSVSLSRFLLNFFLKRLPFDGVCRSGSGVGGDFALPSQHDVDRLLFNYLHYDRHDTMYRIASQQPLKTKKMSLRLRKLYIQTSFECFYLEKYSQTRL